ncbi:hypothetical protein B484DRAFT_442523 [Ochromonadaceae sp. CCMP2298]|nr:hypothetical protein B484DRAFT_442523 [Ochromonadaceae sp. CCMP2298]
MCIKPYLSHPQVELVAYLGDMFGNTTRIDYGTGHELNFAVLFLTLQKLGLLTSARADLRAVVARAFPAYIRTMRRLQTEYMLEPAGSHGVWGLDDYHCLLFVWGAAQLSNQHALTPSMIHTPALKEHVSRYLYFEAIDFIKRIKSCAPFAETSPMLNDISALHDWGKICSGLMRLLQGEVLNKYPVIQHLLFGSLLQCTWGGTDTSTGTSTDTTPVTAPTPSAAPRTAPCTSTPAPWATAPHRSSTAHNTTTAPHTAIHSASTIAPWLTKPPAAHGTSTAAPWGNSTAHSTAPQTTP